MTRRPSTSISVSIASRVVPAPVGDDHPLGAEEGVDQRGLAGVGAADHGDPGGVVGLAGLGAVAEQLDHAVEQVAAAEAVAGGDRHRLAEAELVQLGGHVLVLGPVDFVGDDEDRDIGAAQRLRQLGVAGAHPGAGVDDQHHHVGLGDPQPRLLLDVAGQLVVVVEVDAAGVEQLEGDPVPLAARPACGRG